MVIQKIMFSPCMVCENEEIYDWVFFNDILDFINEYLDCGLDSIEESIFNEQSWYTPPTVKVNMYSFFTSNIVPKLSELLRRGEVYSTEDLETDSICDIKNADFNITNEKEIKLLMNYTANINRDYILFVGRANFNLSGDFVKFHVDDNEFLIPVVREPYIEKSGCFNDCIKDNGSKEIFVNAQLCNKLDQEMKKKAMAISGSKGSLYKKYGKIIALRNWFTEYHPKNPYNADTKYFISKDKKYILSIDLLHGHFEVYEGNNSKKQWIAEYNFSGVRLSPENMSKKELEEMRNNHRVEA